MDHLEFPGGGRHITSINYGIFSPGTVFSRPPFRAGPIQAVSSGISYWRGVVTLGVIEENDPLLKQVSVFLQDLEFGLNTFILPFEGVQFTPKERKPDAEGNRFWIFPNHTEEDADTSVKLTAATPHNALATRIGLASRVTLDTPSGVGEGLRAGDFFSLHSLDGSLHWGLYQCRAAQDGDSVVVRPRIPPFRKDENDMDIPFRVNTRTPSLPVRVLGDLPTNIRQGEWYMPTTFQWVQAVDHSG